MVVVKRVTLIALPAKPQLPNVHHVPQTISSTKLRSVYKLVQMDFMVIQHTIPVKNVLLTVKHALELKRINVYYARMDSMDHLPVYKLNPIVFPTNS